MLKGILPSKMNEIVMVFKRLKTKNEPLKKNVLIQRQPIAL